MNKFIKYGVSLLTVATLVACQAPQTKTTDNKTNTAAKEPVKEEIKFKNVKDSSFLLTKDGKVISQDTSLENTDVIDWYIDPFCPACVMLETIMEDKLDELTDKMVIRYHPLSFLSPQSEDDYSNRAAAYILGTAEYAPDLTQKYLTSILNEEYHPGVGVETSDEKFKGLFLSIGGTEEQWKQIVEAHEPLIKQVKSATAKAFNSKELIAKSPTGKLTVPFVILGDSEQALNFSDAIDAETYFMTQFDEYTNKKEIKDNQYSVEKLKEKETTTSEAKDETKTSETTTSEETKTSSSTEEKKDN